MEFIEFVGFVEFGEKRFVETSRDTFEIQMTKPKCQINLKAQMSKTGTGDERLVETG
jgi:hypothetical protein